MKQVETCHRYESCSVNNCPLADEDHFTEDTDHEIKCPLPEYDTEKIKERYNRIKANPVVVPEPDPMLISKNMRDEQGNLYRMTAEQSRKVYTLIKKECCNIDKGKCKYLCDDDLKCPQLLTATVVCAWCREAIIPLNRELEAEIFKTTVKAKSTGNSHLKYCAGCGKKFKTITGRGKFCNKCVIENHRKQQIEYRRKTRSKVINSAVLR